MKVLTLAYPKAIAPALEAVIEENPPPAYPKTVVPEADANDELDGDVGSTYEALNPPFLACANVDDPDSFIATFPFAYTA